MIDLDDVTAVIVTRGDVDLAPILATLPYGETIVWNNAERGWESRCFGRYLATVEATRPFIYFQDDDVVFTAHAELLELHEPGRMTVNMPSPWYEAAGYDKLRQALVGAGSIMDRELAWPSIHRYLASYPYDDLFLTYADVVVGMLTPHKRFDLGYEVLPHASAPGRIYTTPGAAKRKQEMQRRALQMREAVR
jgi:hypothetical protein